MVKSSKINSFIIKLPLGNLWTYRCNCKPSILERSDFMLGFMVIFFVSIILIMIIKVFGSTTEEEESIEVEKIRIYDIDEYGSSYIVRCEATQKKLPKKSCTIEQVEKEADMRFERVVEYNVKKRWRRNKTEFHQFSIRYILYLTEERKDSILTKKSQ